MELIQEGLEGVEDTSIVLVIPSAKEYHHSITDILEVLVNKRKLSCIYVTVSRSYKRLNDLFNKKGISTENILFVDAVSKGLGFDTVDGDFYLLSDPRNLSNLSITISKAVEKLQGEKSFIVFDSLSGLNLYNSAPHISKFFHALTAEIRSWGVGAVVISLEGEFDKELINTFTGFCDKTIRRA